MFRFILEFIYSFQLAYESTSEGIIDISYSKLAITVLSFTLVLVLSIYIFKSIAIFLMARNNQVKNSWLAFVPFANFLVLGKLTGPIRIFSLKVKNIGVLLSISLFIACVISNFIDIYCYYDEFYILITQGYIPEEITYVPSVLFTVFSTIDTVLYFVLIVFIVWFNICFVSKFSKKHTILLSIIMTLLFSTELFYLTYNLVLAIVVMVLKNKKPFDINEFLAKQREMQQKQAQNTNYGNPNQNTQNNIDDPFEEFSDKKPTDSGLDQDVFSDFSPKADYTDDNNKKRENNDNSDDLFD
ncbi:MAG: hypothetical protein IJF75_04380 [Clostridia bacterium]|nr:hypothetical protein [Clostridia bacterium]